MSTSAKKPIVLVVEDEPLIRVSAALMVEDAGYIALEARHADEAIAILRTRNDIAAVFTDINMSGTMDGWNLARAIRMRWPSIHLIMTSGLALPSDSNLPDNSLFLPKPYGEHQLVAALRALFAPAEIVDEGYGHLHDHRIVI